MTWHYLITSESCKNEEEKDVKSIKIGITLYDQYDTFISELMTEFTKYAADKEKASGVTINLEILDAAQSQLTRNEQVKGLIDKGCDVVCVNLAYAIAANGDKSDIPLIDRKYVRTPYHKVTPDNIEEYAKKPM